MRLLIAAFLLIQVSLAYANCNVYIPEREFHHDSGYTITFNFAQLLGNKNYTEVYSPEEADYVLNVSGREAEGRFHKAVTNMEMGGIKAEESVTCLTQLCGLADYARSFNKVYKSFDKKLPKCE